MAAFFQRPHRTSSLRQALDRKRARALDGNARPTAGDGGGGGEDEDAGIFQDRHPRRVFYGMVLGHLLFSCPTVVSAAVNHWMSWNLFDHASERGPSVEEAFDRLLFTVLNDGVDLQLNLQRRIDRIHAETRATYDLSTMHNVDKRPSDYACGEHILVHALQEASGDLGEWRLRATIAYLLADVDATLFTHTEEHIDGNGALHRNFMDNDIVALPLDRSAHFVVLGVYLATYLDRALETSEADAEDSREAGRRVLARYTDVALHIQEKCMALAKGQVVLPEALCRYAPDAVDDETLCCGVPLHVVATEAHTLLWLQWAWREHIVARGVSVLALLQNLWYAKSRCMLDRYTTFFLDFADVHILNHISASGDT